MHCVAVNGIHGLAPSFECRGRNAFPACRQKLFDRLAHYLRMRQMRESTATLDFRMGDIWKRRPKLLFAPATIEWLAVAAHRQNRLPYRRQD